jgi:hypothetical protein
MARANPSVALPALEPTTMVMGRAGKFCALAAPQSGRSMASARSDRRWFIGLSLIVIEKEKGGGRQRQALRWREKISATNSSPT